MNGRSMVNSGDTSRPCGASPPRKVFTSPERTLQIVEMLFLQDAFQQARLLPQLCREEKFFLADRCGLTHEGVAYMDARPFLREELPAHHLVDHHGRELRMKRNPFFWKCSITIIMYIMPLLRLPIQVRLG